MFPEFKLEPDSPPDPGRKFTLEEERRIEIMMSRRLSREENLRLEALLLDRLKQHKAALEEMLKIMSDHWTYGSKWPSATPTSPSRRSLCRADGRRYCICTICGKACAQSRL